MIPERRRRRTISVSEVRAEMMTEGETEMTGVMMTEEVTGTIEEATEERKMIIDEVALEDERLAE